MKMEQLPKIPYSETNLVIILARTILAVLMGDDWHSILSPYKDAGSEWHTLARAGTDLDVKP